MIDNLCPCRSGVPFKACCFKKKVWTIQTRTGKSIIFKRKKDKGMAFPIFLTKKDTLEHIATRAETALVPAKISIKHLIKYVAPNAKQDGIEGFVLRVDGTGDKVLFCPFHENRKLFNENNNVLFVPEDTPESDLIDGEWFEQNPTLSYRIRPITDSEASQPNGSKDLVVIVVQEGPDLYFRGAVNPTDNMDLIDDLGWDEMAKTLRPSKKIEKDVVPWVRLFRKIF